MRIVVINHYAGSPRHGMEYRPYYLAHEWIRAGHSVTIVAASESHLRSTAVIVRESVTEEYIDGIRYVWLRTPKYEGNGVARVLNIATFVAQGLLHAQAVLGYLGADVIIASSTYPLDIIVALRMRQQSGARLIFEVHDLWPLTPMELGGLKSSNPFVAVMQWSENLAYRSADAVVSLLPNTIEHMMHHAMKPERFHYIPNGVSRESWERSTMGLPKEHLTTLSQLRKSGDF